MNESDIHLITPVLPLLMNLLKCTLIETHWIHLILQCGFQSRSLMIRKTIMTLVIQPATKQIFIDSFISDQEFLFEVYFVYLDQSFLFGTSGDTVSFVSEFGESLVTFMKHLMISVSTSGRLTSFVTRIFSALSEFNNPVAPLFILQSLSEIDTQTKFMDSINLELLIDIRSQKINGLWGKLFARNLYSKYAMNIIVCNVDTTVCDFDQIGRALMKISTGTLSNDSILFCKINSFLSEHYTAHDLHLQLLQRIKMVFEEPKDMRLECCAIARLTSHFVSFCDDKTLLNDIFKILLDSIDIIHSHIYTKQAKKEVTLILLHSIVEEWAIAFPSVDIYKKSKLLDNTDQILEYCSSIVMTGSYAAHPYFMVYIQLMDVLCGEGIIIREPVRNEFDQVNTFSKNIRIQPLLKQNNTSCKVLDYMESWRLKCHKDIKTSKLTFCLFYI